jgi:histidyl-tRNA synthetase
MYKRISGAKDVLPEESLLWQELEQISRRVFRAYNYREIRTPLLEEEALFSRSLGGASEIVQKQMFIVRNQDEVYALRPEGTAGLARAYIENNLDKGAGFAKLYYIGPMFRRERPQKGRLRQFHHIGCEAIGSHQPQVDIEVIALAHQLLRNWGAQGHQIKLNSLGCPKDKQALTQGVASFFKAKLSRLCADCKIRIEKNPLRILDCKNDACREAANNLSLGQGRLCPECNEHFSRVREGLTALGIDYEIYPALVRGLDYYTRTVFEISHPGLGSQDALGAGGRYDNLIKELGGPDLGAVGFAFGVERLLLVTSHKSQVTSRELVYLIALGEQAKKEGLKLLGQMRQAGICCDTDYENKSLKGALRKANDLAAKAVLILGDDELKKGAVTLKDMQSGEQKEVALASIVAELI